MKRLFFTFLFITILTTACFANDEAQELEREVDYIRDAVIFTQSVTNYFDASLSSDELEIICGHFGLYTNNTGRDSLTRIEFFTFIYSVAKENGIITSENVVNDKEYLYTDLEQNQMFVYQLISSGLITAADGDLFEPYEKITACEAAVSLGKLLFRLSVLSQDNTIIPVSNKKENDCSYLDGDNCLIGHSHVVGIKLNTDCSDIFCSGVVGISTVGALYSGDFPMPDTSIGTISDLLSQNNYDRIFIMLGTNDTPGGINYSEVFIEAYNELILQIKAEQPEAVIYICSIAPVGRIYCNYSPAYDRTAISFFNCELKELCRRYELNYIDIFTVLSDHQGYTSEELEYTDGLHFNAAGYDLILKTIRKQA